MNIIYIVNIKPNNLTDNRLFDMIQLCNKYYSKIKFHVLFNGLPGIEKKVDDVIKNNKIDLILCNYGEGYIVKTGLPVIIIERYDSCTLTPKNKEYLKYENVKALFKEYTCSDIKQNNKAQIKNRLHYTLLNSFYNTGLNKQKQGAILSQEMIKKIRPVSWNLHQYSFICNSAMDFAKSREETDLEKDIDVFFVCNPHDDHDILYKHRTSGQLKLKESGLCEKYNIKTDHIDNRRKYRETAIRSKICICPYGLGSRIALDQLAILSGSIVIKPPMCHINTTPDIYKNDFFEYVNYDWDDLIEKIKHILSNWDCTYKKKGIERRREAIEKYTEKYYVDKFVDSIKSVC